MLAILLTVFLLSTGLKYCLIFFGSVLVDVVPFPFPPAFTLMVYVQIRFGLDIWTVIATGVAGSILGRYLLILYIPKLSGRFFKQTKNEDIRFLGQKMQSEGWKGQLFVIFYSLMPIPTTPLFLAAGIAGLRPYMVIPSFFVGKFISDAVAVNLGKFAAENTASFLKGMISWESIAGLVVGLLLIFIILFVDWIHLIRDKKLLIEFNIFK